MEENNETFEEFLQKPLTEKERYISWEREMSYLMTQGDNLKKNEPDLGTEEHIEWLINMNYLDSLIPNPEE